MWLRKFMAVPLVFCYLCDQHLDVGGIQQKRRVAVAILDYNVSDHASSGGAVALNTSLM